MRSWTPLSFQSPDPGRSTLTKSVPKELLPVYDQTHPAIRGLKRPQGPGQSGLCSSPMPQSPR
jgi:hypothetical protein